MQKKVCKKETLPKELYIVNDNNEVKLLHFLFYHQYGYVIYGDEDEEYSVGYLFNDTHVHIDNNKVFLNKEDCINDYIKSLESSIDSVRKEITQLEHNLLGDESDLYYFKQLNNLL